MTDIIKKVHAQWLVAKQQAEDECRQSNHNGMADKYRDCRMFKGTEDLAAIVDLLTCPAGREFVIKRHFPSVATFRLFKSQHPEQYGVYIDAGEISLNNPQRVVLVGRTHATIHIDKCAPHEIIVIRGAKLSLFASDWGMAHLEVEKGCQVITSNKDHALILW